MTRRDLFEEKRRAALKAMSLRVFTAVVMLIWIVIVAGVIEVVWHFAAKYW